MMYVKGALLFIDIMDSAFNNVNVTPLSPTTANVLVI